jgi:hypothetical protein
MMSGATLMSIPPSEAAPQLHLRFDDTTSWVVDDFCGDIEVAIEFHDQGVLLIRQTRDGLPRYTVTHHGGSTITNVATGKAFTFTWHYLEQEVKLTDNGDGTHTVLFQVPGPETIYGPDGERLNVNGGTYRVLLIVDQAGTPSDPSDDFVVSEEFVSSHGDRPQPPFDFCDSFSTLTS